MHDERPRRLLLRRIATPVLLAIIVSTVAIAVSSSRDTVAPSVMRKADQEQRDLLHIPQSGLRLGFASAPVTVTEYADLQCPYCDAYTLVLFPRLVTEYVRSGRVKMIFRPLSFVGRQSTAAGRAALAAARQNRLWNFVDAFYYRQQPENSGYVTPSFVKVVARQVPGLNTDRLLTDASSPSTLTTMRAFAATAAHERVTATPTFLIARVGRAPQRVVGFVTLPAAILRAVGA